MNVNGEINGKNPPPSLTFPCKYSIDALYVSQSTFVFPEIVESATSHLIDQLRKRSSEQTLSETISNENLKSSPLSFQDNETHTLQTASKNNTPSIGNNQYSEILEDSSLQYLTILSDHELKIIHKPNLLKEYLKIRARYFNGDTLPLLVALKLNIEPSINFCRQLSPLGFEIEKDSETNQYFLKEVPLYMTVLEDLNISLAIVEHLYNANHNLKDFNQAIGTLPANFLITKNTVIKNILKNNGVGLDDKIFTRTLSNHYIEELFL